MYKISIYSLCWLRVFDHNNSKKSSTSKFNKHAPSGCSLFTHCSFDAAKNKLHYYRDKNCIKNFCKDLKEHIIKLMNREKKEMLLLTIEESNHIMSKTFFIYENKNLILVIMIKSEIIFILMENIEELLIMFAIYITKHQKKFL